MGRNCYALAISLGVKPCGNKGLVWVWVLGLLVMPIGLTLMTQHRVLGSRFSPSAVKVWVSIPREPYSGSADL